VVTDQEDYMKRHFRWLALLSGIVAIGAGALSAAPSSATVVCPSGIKPPSPYCTNVQPTATTGAATNVTAKSATLNGVAGPNVAGGDPTQYFFRYGTTTAYGNQTPTGTIGSCPAGISPPSPYCNTPATQAVSADISHLTPCTTYHYQLFASNPDGSASGGDRTFTTAFAPPIQHVSAPGSVKSGKKFKVKVGLRYDVQSLTVQIRDKNGNVVKSVTISPASAGKHTFTFRAPKRKGKYTIVVKAKTSCGTETVTRRLKVH
jgi:hypothetical protein